MLAESTTDKVRISASEIFVSLLLALNRGLDNKRFILCLRKLYRLNCVIVVRVKIFVQLIRTLEFTKCSDIKLKQLDIHFFILQHDKS